MPAAKVVPVTPVYRKRAPPRRRARARKGNKIVAFSGGGWRSPRSARRMRPSRALCVPLLLYVVAKKEMQGPNAA